MSGAFSHPFVSCRDNDYLLVCPPNALRHIMLFLDARSIAAGFATARTLHALDDDRLWRRLCLGVGALASDYSVDGKHGLEHQSLNPPAGVLERKSLTSFSTFKVPSCKPRLTMT